MNIEACDKGSGNKEAITITNEKGRLSSEDIERMVQEAEKYKEEDELAKDSIESKNKLESFIYQIKDSFGNSEVKSKLRLDDENNLIDETIRSSENWLDENQNSTKEVYDQKYDEINTMLNPILMKVQSQGDGSGPTNIDQPK